MVRTAFSEDFKISYPLIVAPMFLVSNEDLVVEGSEAGALGSFPALNFRPIEKYREALKRIRSRTRKPIGVNIIVNQSNQRQGEDLKWALEAGVELFITSLGNPKTVIQEAHRNGAKVYCDVTNLEHARKVQDLGADGVIAVGSGAGGHAGPISPLVLIPWLKRELRIPIVAAGGVAQGAQMAACLLLGASAVSVGTRFIASREAMVNEEYKQAVVKASPEDIILTRRISGTPASVIRTPFIEKQGTELPILVDWLKKVPGAKPWVNLMIHGLGMKALEDAATKPSWKTVWSAGQSAGLVDEILPCRKIVSRMIEEFEAAVTALNESLSYSSRKESANKS